MGAGRVLRVWLTEKVEGEGQDAPPMMLSRWCFGGSLKRKGERGGGALKWVPDNRYSRTNHGHTVMGTLE